MDDGERDALLIELKANQGHIISHVTKIVEGQEVQNGRLTELERSQVRAQGALDMMKWVVGTAIAGTSAGTAVAALVLFTPK